MKYFMFLGAWAVAFFVATPLFAQVATPTGVTEDEGSAVLVATVNVANVSHVQQENLFTISFDISNRIGVQPGVKYGVLLGRTEADNFTVVDQRVYDEVLVLGEGESLSKSITYLAPRSLDGNYTLYVISGNESGLQYAFVPVAEVTLKSSVTDIRIDTASCYLTVRGSEATYGFQQRVDIADGETLVSHCTVQNTSDKQIEVTPIFEMRKHSPFGPMVSMVGGDRAPITFAPGESREIATELPTVNAPQEYVVKLRLGLEGAGVTYRFQLQGPSARVENILFNKDSYSTGEIAQVTVAWNPVGTFNGVRSESTIVLTKPTITAIIADANREVCAEPVQQTVDPDGSLVDTLLIPIIKDCVLATAEVSIHDTEYGALARSNYTFENVVENSVAPPTSPTGESLATNVKPKANVSLWFSLLGLLLGLGLLLHTSWKRKSLGENKVPLALLLLLLGSFSFGVEPVSADSFLLSFDSGANRHRYQLSAVINGTPSSESLSVSGSLTQTSGAPTYNLSVGMYRSVDGMPRQLLRTFYLVTGTTNLITPYTETITGPFSVGNHTLQVTADSNATGVTLPFTITSTLSPCSATTISGCLVPARASGFSAGACATTPNVDCNTGLPDAAGECIWSGTCSYSCNNGNWNLGYNACVLERDLTVEPNLVNLGVSISEPPPPGGGDMMFNQIQDNNLAQKQKQNWFANIWNNIKAVAKSLAVINKPQEVLAVYEGQTLDLVGEFENNSTAAINAPFTNKFYYQWGGTGGTWIDVPGVGTVTHNSVDAGASLSDSSIFTVPARESDTLYIRYCLDVLDQVTEYGADGPLANCSVSSVTVQMGTLVCSAATVYEPWKETICLDAYSCGVAPGCVVYNGDKNLTTNAAGPTESFADEPTELVAQIINNGSESTDFSFVNLFQVAEDDLGTGAVDVGTQTVDPLGGLGKAIVKFNYVFPASAAGTNKFIRVCADKSSADNSGVIEEANELLGDNCGPWNSILIKPACPAGETKSWSENGRTCSAVTPAGTKNGISTLTDVTGPDTGSAEFLCQNNRTWAATPQLGAICTGAITHCAPVVGKSWTVDTHTCVADAPQTAINTIQPLTDSTGLETGTATFLCRGDGTWEVNPEVNATCTAVTPNNSPSVSAGSPNIIITLPTDFVSPSGVTVQDSDGSIAGVAWAIESSPSGSSPSIANSNSQNPTFTNLDVIGDYVFRLTATDNLGAQNSDTVTVTVNPPPPPWATISANPTVVIAGGTSQITWDSEQFSVCSVTSSPGSDSWSGLDGTQTTSLISLDTTYIVTCDGTPRDSVTIRVSPDVTLTADKYIVRAGEPVEINWNTNGNDETLCRLTQNGQPTTGFLDGDGVGSKTVTLSSRTRFTLTCGGQSSHIDIEMRPIIWNS